MSAVAPSRVPPTAAASNVVAFRPCPNATAMRPSCKRRDCEVCGPIWAGNQKRVLGSALGHYATVVSAQVESERLLEGDVDELLGREGPVAMVQLTPPGADRLPWACKRVHRNKDGKRIPHSGPRGCRLEQRAARDWCETFTLRRSGLRRAGNAYVRRRICQCGHTRRAHRGGGCACGCGCEGFRGFQPAFLVKVLEPQKRGAPHAHEVFGFTSLAERRAVRLWNAWLRDTEDCGCGRTKRWHDAGGPCEQPRSPTFGWSHLRQYDFGEETGTQHGLRAISGEEATRYLVTYLTGRSRHKPSIRQNIVDPAMTYWAVRDAAARGTTEPEQVRPRRYSLPLVWVSPRLTSFRLGGCGVTMRALRMKRQMNQVLRGRYVDDRGERQPRWWWDVRSVLETAVVHRRVSRRGDPNPDDDAAAARFATEMIERYEATPPGYPKLELYRALMGMVPSIAEPPPAPPKLRLVASEGQLLQAAA